MPRRRRLTPVVRLAACLRGPIDVPLARRLRCAVCQLVQVSPAEAAGLLTFLERDLAERDARLLLLLAHQKHPDIVRQACPVTTPSPLQCDIAGGGLVEKPSLPA